MNPNVILLPVLAQIILTLAVYVLLAIEKSKALKQGLVDHNRRSLYDDAWPESVLKINNNIRNQFEVPVLFYVLCIMLWLLHVVDWPALILAWLFVASRWVHAWMHTGKNVVPIRKRIFTVGVVALMGLTLLVLRVVWSSFWF